MSRAEKLLVVFLGLLRSGDQYMGISKQILSEQFAEKFPTEPLPTNQELVNAFLDARDRGWIDVLGLVKDPQSN